MYYLFPITGFLLLIDFIKKAPVRRAYRAQANKTRSKKETGKSFNSFQSLCLALSSTLGTGNIAGVATAIVYGGPGAVFWMWISSLFGMVTHYYEVFLGVKFQQKTSENTLTGGPMYYIRDGLHNKALAQAFALFAILASLGVGNIAQSNTIAELLFFVVHLPKPLTGSLSAFVVALIIFGGQKRIASVTAKLIPFMAILYLYLSISFLYLKKEMLSSAFCLIFHHAFHSASILDGILGGIFGYSVRNAIRLGIMRGVYSNEAGTGSSVIAHASSANDPHKQGKIAVLELMVDTFIMCTITALVILTSGVYDVDVYQIALANGTLHKLPNGAVLTELALRTEFGEGSTLLLAFSLILFAFSTFLGWCYYGEQAIYFLFGAKGIFPYRILFFLVIILGSMLRLSFVFRLSDSLNLCMALPNLIALLFLRNKVWEKT